MRLSTHVLCTWIKLDPWASALFMSPMRINSLLKKERLVTKHENGTNHEIFQTKNKVSDSSENLEKSHNFLDGFLIRCLDVAVCS